MRYQSGTFALPLHYHFATFAAGFKRLIPEAKRAVFPVIFRAGALTLGQTAYEINSNANFRR